jgi:short-subunit dehydrogenase
MADLENKNIVITGAFMGVGPAIAYHLATFSFKLILFS